MNAPMKRCTKCGNEFPATSEHFPKRSNGGLQSWCKSCTNQYLAQYHKVHRQQHREQTKQWQNNNREKARLSNRNSYAKYKKVRLALSRTWRRAHQSKSREYTRKYRITHPAAGNISARRREARKRHLAHDFTATNWRDCLDYWNYCCAYCGRPRGLWHTLAQDHFVPLIKDGGYTPDNIVPACHSMKDGCDGCNNSKQARDPYEWLIEKFGPRKAKQIEQRIADYFAWVKQR